MGKFSRWMPPSPVRTMGPVGMTALVAGVFATLYLVFGRNLGAALAALIGLVLVTVLENWRHAKSLQKLAADRASEDIGTFARALKRRSPEFDPWVVRAVWDALGRHLRFEDRCVPLRPGDRLLEDLQVDSEDLEDIAIEVARRVGRDATDWSKNPVAGAVLTVEDLVRLVASQPRTPAA